MDGPSQCRWHGTLGCSTPPRPNVRTGASRVAATASIGQTSMRTSVRRGYSGEHPPRVRPMSRHRATRDAQEIVEADLLPACLETLFSSGQLLTAGCNDAAAVYDAAFPGSGRLLAALRAAWACSCPQVQFVAKIFQADPSRISIGPSRFLDKGHELRIRRKRNGLPVRTRKILDGNHRVTCPGQHDRSLLCQLSELGDGHRCLLERNHFHKSISSAPSRLELQGPGVNLQWGYGDKAVEDVLRDE